MSEWVHRSVRLSHDDPPRFPGPNPHAYTSLAIFTARVSVCVNGRKVVVETVIGSVVVNCSESPPVRVVDAGAGERASEYRMTYVIGR